MIKTPTEDMRFAVGAKPPASRVWWPVVLALSCFLLARPYEGFVHDSRLYIGYAIAPLDPTGIGADLLFVHDEQSGRSLYPVLLRGLSQTFGPSLAALGVTVASLALWFSGAWQFVRRLFPDATELGVAIVLVMATTIHTYYGGSTTFHFAEPFASPRVLAESLVLWGLAYAVDRRWAYAISPLVAAMAIHPLMGIAGVGVLIWLVLPTTRVRVALTLMACVGAGALLLVSARTGASSGVLRVFDREWLGVLDEMGALVFLRNWESLDWARITVHAATLAMAVSIVPRTARSVIAAVGMVAGSGMLFAWFGADVAHNVLFTQAQLWRSLWLFGVMAGISLGWLVYWYFRAWREPYTNLTGFRVVAVAVAIASWFMLATSTSAATLSLVALMLWYVPVIRPGFMMPFGVARGARVVLPLLLVLMVAVEGQVVWQVYAASPGQQMLWYWPTFVLGGGMRLLGPMLLHCNSGTFLWSAGQHSPNVAAKGSVNSPVAFATLGVALLMFDSRTAYEKALERALDRHVYGRATKALNASSLGRSAYRDATGPVFWEDGELETWAFFGRPGYGNVVQGTPRVFSREIAVRWSARRRQIGSLQSVARAPRYRVRLDKLESDDRTGIQQLCLAADAPETVLLWRRPRWATHAPVFVLPEPQLLVGQDPGAPWEIRRAATLISCDSLLHGSGASPNSDDPGVLIRDPDA